MYTLTRGPSKIAAKTRRAPTSPIEANFDQLLKRDKEEFLANKMSLPKPVFNHVNNRLNKLSSQYKNGQRVPETNGHDAISLSVSQEEVVKYISELWSRTSHDYETHLKTGGRSSPLVIYYKEKAPNPKLENFEPFDLEAWWGHRMLQNIVSSSNTI